MTFTKNDYAPLKGFPERMALLDCETTGGKATRDRITELAIILVDDGVVTEQWQSLINPEVTIPPWITNITGIHTSMLLDQPNFKTLWPLIKEKLNDRVLVAHNARFDYGFLKNEAIRCGDTFSARTLCSVKLSRLLYPQFKSHSLDAIIKRLKTTVSNRHRAMDDTLVIWQLFQKMMVDFDEQKISVICNKILKRPSLPSKLDEKQVSNLPDTPGVYYFYNENHKLLYVGKSVNIRTRVLSHFHQDHQTSVDSHLSHQLHHIEYDETPSDFGAQLLEAKQVKLLNPSLNRRLKKVTHLYQFVISQENGYQTIQIEAARSGLQQETFGLFRSKKQATQKLEKLVNEHLLCHRLSGLEKKKSGSCFAFQLKKCMGACCHKEPKESYNLRVQNAMQALRKEQWPFPEAIVVMESNPVTQLKSYHLINNWCYLSEIKTPTDLWTWEPMLSKHHAALTIDDENSYFDLDTYFILIKFLLSEEMMKRSNLKIITIENASNQLSF